MEMSERITIPRMRLARTLAPPAWMKVVGRSVISTQGHRAATSGAKGNAG